MGFACCEADSKNEQCKTQRRVDLVSRQLFLSGSLAEDRGLAPMSTELTVAPSGYNQSIGLGVMLVKTTH